ncbi:hypothetical protein H6B51_12345 [Pseudoflavonifractor phocaeensis]|nr:hypothetical protein [Pseudoflavonifractor phocaeensis]
MDKQVFLVTPNVGGSLYTKKSWWEFFSARPTLSCPGHLLDAVEYNNKSVSGQAPKTRPGRLRAHPISLAFLCI